MAAVAAAGDANGRYTPGKAAPSGEDAQAWNAGVYNASGSITIPGYRVDTADIKPSNWTLEERLVVNYQQTAWTNLALRDASGSLDNITSGWNVCSHIRTVPRISADPVDATCKGILHDDCIAALKAAVSTHGNCSAVAPTVCAPGAKYQGRKFLCFNIYCRALLTKSSVVPFAKNATVDAGWLPHGGFRDQTVANGTKDYDNQVKEITVVALGWSHNGTDKDLESSVMCFGYTDVQPGSRSIKEAISGSAAPTHGLSWAVAGLALFMAL